MGDKRLKVRATATVANVSCGFDCIGYSIGSPADILTLEIQDRPGLELTISGEKSGTIPLEAEDNTAGKAILSLLNSLDRDTGFRIHIEKGIPPGSGLGSSAASAVAGVVGVNELLGNPMEENELLVHCMAGETASAPTEHADNVAPSLMGGIVLIRSYEPLEVLKLNVPDNLYSTVVLPDYSVNTRDARNILPKTVPLKSAITQSGNLAGFILGLEKEDFDLLGRSMVDLFAEPVRKKLIPGFESVRQAALDSGAIGCGISGSGPTLFALSSSEEDASKIGKSMVEAFLKKGLKSRAYSSLINNQPAKILD